MTPIKIGIVEDEMIIARNIISTLNEMGYGTCGPAINYTEAIHLLTEEKPDLLLLDISLSGRKDGIDVAMFINENQPIPFIFLTALSDTQTIERAKKVKPHAYIVKPFSKEELFASIEIAFSNDAETKKSNRLYQPEIFHPEESLFIKKNAVFHKVYFSDILYVESKQNYVKLNLTDQRSFIVRSGFTEFFQKLPDLLFLQVHRSFVINLQHVDALDVHEVVIKEHKIPLGKTHQVELMKRLGIEE